MNPHRIGILFLTGLLLGQIAHAEPLRLMLSVGQNEGLADELPLRFAHQDARAFAQTFQRLGHVGQENTILLTESDARGLKSALTTLRERAAAHSGEVMFLFYYSGHGDRNALHLGSERFPLTELKDALNAVPAELRIAVIDACRSPDDTRAKGFKPAAPFALNLRAPQGLRGVVTIRSSSDGEDSQESAHLEGAVFTHYLLNALRGAADRDGDRRVTLSEAYGYAYDQTVRRSAAGTANVMHPSVDIDLDGAGRLNLTRVSPQTATLRLPQEKSARYLLYRRPAGTLVAEMWSSETHAVGIPITSGEYLVQRRSSQGAGALVTRAQLGETVTVSRTAFQAISEDILAAKGGQLRLWRHVVSAGYMPGINHVGGFSQRAQVRYGFGPHSWLMELGVDMGQQAYDTTHDQRTERWFGGDIRGGCPRCLGPLDLQAGLMWRIIRQRLERRDSALAEAAGYVVPTDYVGFASGPTVAMQWNTPLSHHWALVIETQSALLFAKQGSVWGTRPSGGLGFSIRWSH